MLPDGGMRNDRPEEPLDFADTQLRTSLLVDHELAPDGIVYRAWYFSGNVYMAPLEDLDNSELLFSASSITELTLSFDQLRRPMVAYVQNGATKLWWFDASSGSISILSLPAVTSPFLTRDDKRREEVSFSDVLLFYVKDGNLCTRTQRDRFTIERVEWSGLPARARRIRHAGMNRDGRVQVYLYAS